MIELGLVFILIVLTLILAAVIRSYRGLLQNQTRLNNQLKDQKSIVQHIFHDSPVAIVHVDSDGHLSQPSPSFLDLYKVKDYELNDRTLWNFIDPDYIPAAKSMVAQSMETKTKVRDVFQTRNALFEEIWAQVDCIPQDQGLVVALTNISSAIKTQELTEKFMRGIDGVQILSITDRNGLISYVNEPFSHISGYDADEIIGRSHAILRSHFHPKEFWQTLWETILSGKVWRGQIKNKDKFGKEYWVSSTILPMTDSDGRPMQFISVSRDITNEKKVEEELRLSLLRSEFENKIWRVIDRVYSETIQQNEINKIGVKILEIVCQDLGWDLGQMYKIEHGEGQEARLIYKIGYVVNGEDNDALKNGLRQFVLEKGQDLPGYVWNSGRPLWFDELPLSFQGLRNFEKCHFSFETALCVPIFANADFFGVIELLSREPREKNEQITRALSILADYFGKVVARREHEHRLLEYKDQLALSAKMSMLGEMASGIAHEINNPITIIQSYAGQLSDLVRRGLDRTGSSETLHFDRSEQSSVQKAVEKITATTQRIVKIIGGLRSYARDGSADPFIRTTVKSIIDDSLSLCEVRIKAMGVELSVNSYDTSLAVECRAVQISQILINLINNGLDAIEEFPQKWIRVEILDGGELTEIRVVDCGGGIPADVAKKIMQPFFTTKSIGKGTGLGLSIAKGIAEAHGGEFGVDMNAPNTTFYLKLPKKHVKVAPRFDSQDGDIETESLRKSS